jgi:hypothetical protein
MDLWQGVMLEGEERLRGERQRERSCESSELNSLKFPKKQNLTFAIPKICSDHHEPISGRGTKGGGVRGGRVLMSQAH